MFLLTAINIMWCYVKIVVCSNDLMSCAWKLSLFYVHHRFLTQRLCSSCMAL